MVTVDIDPEVSGWAASALEATGYRDRVTVVTGDGEHGAPGHGPFDAIIATAGAWTSRPRGSPSSPTAARSLSRCG